jgi:hypothetical protein
MMLSPTDWWPNKILFSLKAFQAESSILETSVGNEIFSGILPPSQAVSGNAIVRITIKLT